jgi:UDP-3-O-[3-hydroxymyristoyl] glucosamine N-acyltransferase
MHIQELARRLGAEVDPDADVEIHGAATIEDAGPTDVTFLANVKYVRRLRTSKAGAVLVEPGFEEPSAPVPMRVEGPYLAFAKVLEHFHRPPAPPRGIHPTAVLGEDVEVGDDVAVGPYAVIGDAVVLGDGVVVHPHVVVYEGARIGAGSILHSFAVVREHVTLGAGCILQNGAVVGADGFGFAPRPDRSWHKIPQTGVVELGDGVEVQANACVDRATVGATRIGRGTKLDNLVQVGHGSRVGEDTLLCGQTGLAGSSDIGDRVILAGQVGVAGHCRIGNDVVLSAQSGSQGGIEKPGFYGGSPAMDMGAYRRWVNLQPKIPELFRRVKKLERASGDAGA